MEIIFMCIFQAVSVPIFTKQLQGTIYVEAGVKHSLECDAIGVPQPIISWFLDGQPITDDNNVTFNKNHTRFEYLFI